MIIIKWVAMIYTIQGSLTVKGTEMSMRIGGNDEDIWVMQK